MPTREPTELKWEHVTHAGHVGDDRVLSLLRIKVPGGWLYKYYRCIVFVAEIVGG